MSDSEAQMHQIQFPLHVLRPDLVEELQHFYDLLSVFGPIFQREEKGKDLSDQCEIVSHTRL